MRGRDTAVCTSMSNKRTLRMACAVAVVMRVPPDAPTTMRTRPVALSTTMVGDDDDRGRLKGRMKFALDGCRPKAFVMLGELKSSISLFRTIPSAVRTLEPQYLRGATTHTHKECERASKKQTCTPHTHTWSQSPLRPPRCAPA